MGPPCPKPDCPGSDYTGSFIKYYSSSSEDEINEVDGPPATSPPHRVHVLPLEPDSCDPIYCQYQQVQDHEKVKLWKTGKVQVCLNLNSLLLSLFACDFADYYKTSKGEILKQVFS